ncbi:pentapeptide repeat-containing protein [Paenarthrobacter sp. A20]|uniref:pentapeptide repeat-containing protein n=1 Tax=Paenarthrobacter sp. A20 TaxID=2817891 RepID=UPI00209D2277|nr:pentapeptide repeat-containing protein [Paenarthrobacter sp. A20]MCP1413665.1 uncharacterized protein YjbI with pentapeptide repeats [Paenarthrobacter sp. A20]
MSQAKAVPPLTSQKTSKEMKTGLLWIWIPLSVVGATVAAALVYWALAHFLGSNLVPPEVKPNVLDPYDLARSTAVLLGIIAATVGIVVALRRQVAQEKILVLSREDLDLRQAVEDARRNEAVAVERQRVLELREQRAADRLNELRGRYVTCAQQLGHDEEAIRLAGAYGMAQLASEWEDPAQRQSCVDVLCAYLRMPVKSPEGRPVEENQREVEVRRSVTRIVTSHLRPGSKDYWTGVSVNLAGAQLVEGDFRGVVVGGTADFSNATFLESAYFADALFEDEANFQRAVFMENCSFTKARFAKQANFDHLTCQGRATFTSATFSGVFSSRGSDFVGRSVFSSAKFQKSANFEESSFSAPAGFATTYFGSDAVFEGTLFKSDANFYQSKFMGGAGFKKVEFTGTLRFDKSYFKGRAGFNEAIFMSRSSFQEVTFDGGLKMANVSAQSEVMLDWSRIRKNWTLEGSKFDMHFGVARVFTENTPLTLGAIFSKRVNWEAVEVAEGMEMSASVD